jgi:predicted AAA+ superfamily ATPase
LAWFIPSFFRGGGLLDIKIYDIIQRKGLKMRYLKRKFDSWLVQWHKNPDRKPLLVKGARQVGKTESIRNFAKKHYENFIEINFVFQPEFKQIVNDGYKVDAVIKRITALDPTLHFVPGKTLLFFDEIQEFPDIATSFKDFKIDGRYDIISSGSMLGIHYKQVASIPVGYKTDYNLSSLDFEEFLWECGYEDGFVDEIFSNITARRPYDEMTLGLMEKKFLEYCALGGMPEIVRNYFERGSFEGSLRLQRELFAAYRDDVRKYAVGMDQTRILNVLDHVAQQLAKENKKFQISKVAKDARFKDYRGCIEWLKDAGVINVCNAMGFPELPVGGNIDEAKFKVYFADSGLLLGQMDEESQFDFRANRNLGTYKGGLYENIVAEALFKSGAPLVYYKREDSTLEMDFFLRDADNLVPVEVKAGSAKAKSLKILIESNHYPDITWGIKLVRGNIGFNNGILTLPNWSAFLLKRLMSHRE